MITLYDTSRTRMMRRYPHNGKDLNAEFRCLHCHNYVAVQVWIAGVRHRNHCPYCLWSKHLDLNHAGDRMAACKAGMQPVALSIKLTVKKYALHDQGELMIVHRCTDCGKISLNRIAADDDAERILEVYARSHRMGEMDRKALTQDGVHILAECDDELVRRRIYGGIEELMDCHN